MSDPAPDTDSSEPTRDGAVAGGCDLPPRARMKTHHRIGLWTLALAFILALLAGMAVLAVTGRVITFPDFVSERIAARINHQLDGPQVSIGQVDLLVNRNFVPRVTARNVGLIDASGAEIARFNTLRAVLSKQALKSRRLQPDTLRLSGAQITVRRRVDGSFALDFGGEQRLAGSGADVLREIDRVFSAAPLSEISLVEAREITITLEDARSARIWQAADAAIVLKNSSNLLDISMNFELFNGTENLSAIELGFASTKGSLATTISLNMTDAPTQDFALQSPVLSFLSVVDAPISAAMRAEIDAEGQLQQYAGTLAIDAGRIVAGEGAAPITFEGAKGYFDYDPEKARIAFPEFSLTTDALEMKGRGQVLLGDFEQNWPQSYTGQWQFSELKVDPEGMFDAPLVFDRVIADAKLRLAPFSLDIGRLDLRRHPGESAAAETTIETTPGTAAGGDEGADLWLRGRGRARVTPAGWEAGLDLSVAAMSQAQLMALWPPAAVAKSRDWMAKNIAQATYRDLDLALRVNPGDDRPVIALDWDVDDLEMRFMKTQPPLQQGRGYGAIFGNSMSVTLEEGHITVPQGGQVDVTGTVLRIPDIYVKPARLEIGLKTRSSIEAGLSLMAEKPFNVLRAATFGPDVAKGQSELIGTLDFPLIKKVMFEDVNFVLNGTLRDVASDQLMPGQRLTADQIGLTVDPSGITLAGGVRVGTAQMAGQWHKAFGPEHRGKSDITGRATIDQALLDTFRVSLPTGMMAGQSSGDLNVALRRGEPPRFSLTSDLLGLRLAVSPLGWSKSAKTPGALRLEGTAGAQPDITAFELSGAGMTAEDGHLSLTSGGAFDRLRFGRVRLSNWLDVPVTLIGQGTGKPVRIEVTGGRVNLARATFGGGGKGAPTAGRAVPLEIRLDQLAITDKLRLDGVSASLMAVSQGVKGQFNGRLNGLGPLTGTITPGPFGPVITATSDDAGAVVTASGVLDRASGGALRLDLSATQGEGNYAGTLKIDDIRVQSAPALAELLSAMSVVGLIDQMARGGGILFSDVQSDFLLRSGRLTVRGGTAEGPSLGISMEGLYDGAAGMLDMQGVISPIYFINAVGQVVARKGEGLFGVTYTLKGPTEDPSVAVNPLSILTPGVFREIFRKKPAGDQ